MTQEELTQWKEFVKILAPGLYNKTTKARQDRLVKEAHSFIECCDEDSGNGWNDGVNDHFDSFFSDFDHWRDGEPDPNPNCFFNQLRCLVRVSLNMIKDDDNAAIGWTVGDMRRIFGSPLPEWFASRYDGIQDAGNDEGVVL